jgi:hypothetical protein
MTEEKKGPPTAVIAVGILVVLGVLVAAPEVFRIYKLHHAATPENIASVALDQTPKSLARSLPASNDERTDVKVLLRPGVAFTSATFSWNESPDHVSKISLRAMQEEERAQKKSGANVSRSLGPKLDDALPGVDDRGEREWGAVTFKASPDGDLSFEVKGTAAENQPNQMFARQVEAARQILVEVAFDVPPTLPKQELADTLGTGYSIKELASVDPAAPQADTVRALTSKLAAAIEDSDGVRVPLDHALVSSARLRWSPFRARAHFELSFHPRRSFKDRRAAFVACLEARTGAPALRDGPISVVRFAPGDPLVIKGIQMNVTADTIEGFTYDAGADVPTYSALIGAMDACNK